MRRPKYTTDYIDTGRTVEGPAELGDGLRRRQYRIYKVVKDTWISKILHDTQHDQILEAPGPGYGAYVPGVAVLIESGNRVVDDFDKDVIFPGQEIGIYSPRESLHAGAIHVVESHLHRPTHVAWEFRYVGGSAGKIAEIGGFLVEIENLETNEVVEYELRLSGLSSPGSALFSLGRGEFRFDATATFDDFEGPVDYTSIRLHGFGGLAYTMEQFTLHGSRGRPGGGPLADEFTRGFTLGGGEAKLAGRLRRRLATK